eukprot:TRINITY_DN1480_c0_g1_i1.p1 TRINITY_DN1480_c0_g1~~TRINITY_DN1480_c0_g1_i1.p1  ORF type:complete len:224 (-),score=10.99 TRINITY_DN1480_c0_g1_i1:498-1169(-)
MQGRPHRRGSIAAARPIREHEASDALHWKTRAPPTSAAQHKRHHYIRHSYADHRRRASRSQTTAGASPKVRCKAAHCSLRVRHRPKYTKLYAKASQHEQSDVAVRSEEPSVVSPGESAAPPPLAEDEAHSCGVSSTLRTSSSKHCLTPAAVRADDSMKRQPLRLASASPSAEDTSRLAKSSLLPTIILITSGRVLYWLTSGSHTDARLSNVSRLDTSYTRTTP